MRNRKIKSRRERINQIKYIKKFRRAAWVCCILVSAAMLCSILLMLSEEFQHTKRMNNLNAQLKQERMNSIAESLDIVDKDTAVEKDNSILQNNEELSAEQMEIWFAQIWERNNDFAGWIIIPDTKIDYPVMQCLQEEEYYLFRGFDKANNKNGCLFVDTECNVGKGAGNEYISEPSDNIIIHGHSRKSGEMFGELLKFENAQYAMEHSRIFFDTAYERREYEVIAVFQSPVYKKSDRSFKYYESFTFQNEEEFQYFYEHIKNLTLFDTGTTAEFGDSFLTLSTCSYVVDNTRFVVVAKRIGNHY